MQGGNKRKHGDDDDDDEVEVLNLKLFTLNCWGIKYFTKDCSERFLAIGKYLASSDYDVVFLQEVFTRDSYRILLDAVENVYSYNYYFDTGVVGSGIALFSRHRLQDANYHEFSVNGYPTALFHGDWFAAKGIGVCQIDLQGFNVHLYTTHFHAAYSLKDDKYLSHRVVQALETAQWVNLTSSAADITIFAGDFNLNPTELPYRMLRHLAPLRDTWEDVSGSVEGGTTYGNPYNSYSPKGWPPERIDYIMYCPGPNIKAETISCLMPLPRNIPEKNISYSDHEAVAAVIRVQRVPKEGGVMWRDGPRYRRQISIENRSQAICVVLEAKDLIDKAIISVEKKPRKNAVRTILLLLLLGITFLPSPLFVWYTAPTATFSTCTTAYEIVIIDICAFFLRVILLAFLGITFLMGIVHYKREINCFKRTRNQLQLLLDQDFSQKTN